METGGIQALSLWVVARGGGGTVQSNTLTHLDGQRAATAGICCHHLIRLSGSNMIVFVIVRYNIELFFIRCST